MDYKDLANMLIDDYIELHGHRNTILLLINLGYNKEQICDELCFDKDMYDDIIEEDDYEYE